MKEIVEEMDLFERERVLRSGLGVATYQASSTRRTSNTIGSIQLPLFGAGKGFEEKLPITVERKPRLVAVDSSC